MPEPDIKITSNGPYQINADLPITPKRIVRSPEGDPLTWATDEPLPHDTPTWLCRCGQSSHKPFCDGTHVKVGFEGTEVASTETFSDVEKVYEGIGIKVHRVGPICQHASFCANQSTDWFQMLPDTDDITVKGRVIDMIEHCPSGALVCEIDDEIIEPNYPKAISPVEDGPYWVTGGVTIERSDGITLEVRNRVTLCRCGHSKNQPLCDGTHKEIGFVAKVMVQGQLEGDKTDEPTETERKRIVIGVGPQTSPITLETAAMVTMAIGTDLHIVNAGGDEKTVAGARDLFDAAGLDRAKVSSTVEAGSPVAVLTRYVIESQSELLILERGGEHIARVPHQISYHSPCDVLIVNADRPERPERYRRILIATDGSATADRAAKRGYIMAAALDATVDLVFVGHPATGELIVPDTIETVGQMAETRSWMLEGDPVRRILEVAEQSESDLIVVGNKGMTRTRMMLGFSVPGGVVDGARCDVLLCRTVRQLESELEPGEGGVVERNGEQVAVFRGSDGVLHLMSARCTHLGCVVAWNPGEKQFQCPCHGSAYSPLGEVVQGPANKPLRPVE